MRDGKGIRNSKFEMRKLEIGRKCSRNGRQAPTGVRGADADREGRFDIMQKARMFVKVGWEERRRDGFMQNVEMKWVTL